MLILQVFCQLSSKREPGVADVTAVRQVLTAVGRSHVVAEASCRRGHIEAVWLRTTVALFPVTHYSVMHTLNEHVYYCGNPENPHMKPVFSPVYFQNLNLRAFSEQYPLICE